MSTFQNNNPFHSKFHKPFTIYNESIKYHHASNKFPTRSNQRISSRETLPFRINNNGIYSFFFFYQTPQLRTYTRTFTRSCTTKERDDWFDPHRGAGEGSPIDFSDRSRGGGEATHAKSLLVGGGTRGGWRDGKSEVRVSGSWNRQGCKSSKLVTEPLVALVSPALPPVPSRKQGETSRKRRLTRTINPLLRDFFSSFSISRFK